MKRYKSELKNKIQKNRGKNYRVFIERYRKLSKKRRIGMK